MIATLALQPPARGSALLDATGGIGHPGVAANRADVGRAGQTSADAASFSALLSGWTAPVSAAFPALTAPLPGAPSAFRPTSPRTDIGVGASLAAPIVASPPAYAFAAVAPPAPTPSIAPTGSTPPPTGKVLPPAGQMALAISLQMTAITALADRATTDGAPAEDPLARASEPTDPAAPDPSAATMAQAAIVPALILTPPLAPRDPAPAVAILDTPRTPAQTGRGAPATTTVPQDIASASPEQVKPARPTVGQFAPMVAIGHDLAAAAAPLIRLAADATLPSATMTLQVALPASAALAESPGLLSRSLAQPIARGPGVAVGEPADRADRAGPEAMPADTIPTPVQQSAFIAPAVAQTHGEPLALHAAAPAPRADRIDFATLVDTIASVREHAGPQSASAPVAVSLAHADFGPVALRFRHEGDALAVTMASADPGFAPAVSTATAADANANSAAGQQQQADAQPRQQQSDSSQPQSSGGTPGSGSQSSAQAQPGFSQAGQGQGDQRQPSHGRPALTAPRAGSTVADPGNADPDIFA